MRTHADRSLRQDDKQGLFPPKDMNNIVNMTHLHPPMGSEPPVALWGVALVFLTPALGGFLYGYDIGATSFVLAMLTTRMPTHHSNSRHHHAHGLAVPLAPAPAGPVVWWQDLDQHVWQQGFMIAAVSAGALLGSLAVFWWTSPSGTASASTPLGRRLEIRYAALLYMGGTALQQVAGTVAATEQHIGPACFTLGRLIFGLGVGLIMHGAPTYMAEMSPTSIRGALVSAKETVIVLGIVVGYWVGDALSRPPSESPEAHWLLRNATATTTYSAASSSSPHAWVQLYRISFLLSIPLFLLTFVIPRSKRWLLMHGYREEALNSLKFIYRGSDEQMEYELQRLIQATAAPVPSSPPEDSSSLSVLSSSSSSSSTMKHLSLWSPTVRPAMVAAMGLIILQQCSGQPSIISYATVVFDEAGWDGKATIVTALLMLVVSSTTVMLVDRVGRKRMLSLCCIIMSVSLTVLSVEFWNGASHEFTPTQKTVVLVAMLCFIAGYQVGFGPITWLVVSEVFPGPVRGAATALGVELNYLLNFAVQFLVPIMQTRLGWGPTFGTFAIILMSGIFFVRKYVPETTGLSLEQIQERLQNKHPYHHLHSYTEQGKGDIEVESVQPNERSSLLHQRSSHDDMAVGY